MTLSVKRKAELAGMNIPSDAETRSRLNRFLLCSGLTRSEISDFIGYGHSSLTLFLNGHYAKHHPREQNSLAIRAAIKEFLDLQELASPHQKTGRHYPTEAYKQIRTAAFNALKKGVAYIVDGPPGTEKTESLRRIQQEINQGTDGRCFYVYARINHSPQSFLMECCVAAGIPNRGTIDQLLRKLAHFLHKDRIVLFVDEAQHLDTNGLEVLRQLVDLPPYFGVVLAGSHDLTQRLSHWQMEQWRSRVRKTINLTGPGVAETRHILRSELGDLSDAECDETIAQCKAEAERVLMVRGKATKTKYTYTSARLVFEAIDQVHEVMNDQQKGSAV